MFHQKFEKRNLNRIPYRSYVTFNFSDLEIEFFPRLILWFVEKSILLFFLFFFFFVCFKLRSEVWIERYFVTFRWHNRASDNDADMSTCKLGEIHSHVRAEHSRSARCTRGGDLVDHLLSSCRFHDLRISIVPGDSYYFPRVLVKRIVILDGNKGSTIIV